MDKIKSINRYQIYERKPISLEVKEYAPIIESLAEEVFTHKEKIDYGQSADVFRDSLNGCCYKVITRQTETLLSAEEEAVFLMELQDIDKKVKVPLPLFSLEATVKKEDNGKLTRKSMICMERIEGFSLKDVTLGKADLPEDFNVSEFFSNLRDFVVKMNNDYGIYHRDLHEGNIMVDKDTGMPRVIDFGLSKKKTLVDENPYETEVDIQDRIFKFKNDLEEIVRVENYLIEYLDRKKKGKTKNINSDIDTSDVSFKKIQSASLKEIESFDLAIQNTAKKIQEEVVDAKQIPGSLGLYLVKANTAEFERRKTLKLVLYPKKINKEEYFVCRN